MKRSETLPQPEPGDSKPIAAVPFEVVRQAEFVFEPFVGSLIQLPEIRMQRAQTSEFFLAQSTAQPEASDVVGEEALVWERPKPVVKGLVPPVPTPTQELSATPADTRKAKPKKPTKEQEGPRFYQPPTVRFFDPVAAAAEDGEGAEESELPGPRASTQLSPELKAAILRIDEQRRQMQQGEKQEKPSGKKKRGLLAAKPAARDDVHDVPMEIVKPRDVVLTERAARWEEIAAPPPRRAEPEVLAQPEVQSPAAEAVPPPATETPAAADTEHVAAISSVGTPTPEVPPMPATVAAHAVASPAEAFPSQDEISIHAPVPPPHAAQPPDISAFAPEQAAPEEIVAAPEAATVYESLREPETVPMQDPASMHDATPVDAPVQPPEMFLAIAQEDVAAEETVSTPELSSPYEAPLEEIVSLREDASTHAAIPVDVPVPASISVQPEETIFTTQEDFAAEETVPTLQFALSDDDLREPELAAMPEAASSPAPAPAMPSDVAPERVSLQSTASVKETAPLPPALAADVSTTSPVEAEPVESPATRRFRGITDAIARGKRAEPVMETVEPALPQMPLEEPLEEDEEAERASKRKEKLPLSMRLQRWLAGESSKLDGNRRRADRTTMPGLVAFYWSGGSPRPHEIVNISKTGFYLKTREFWSLETLVRMTLQRPPTETKPKAESISVLARVVRIDEDGVGHEFVTTEALMHARSMDVMPSHGTDARELDKFLQIR